MILTEKGGYIMRTITVEFMSGTEMKIKVNENSKVYVNGWNELVIDDKVVCWNVNIIR